MSGTYRTIVADPPWPIESGGGTTTPPKSLSSTAVPFVGRGERFALPYAAMPLDAIDALPVAALAERDAHLYLWTTNGFLEAAYQTARAWGFRPSQLLTWCKTPRGVGFGGAFTTNTEFVIFARRGTLKHTARQDSAWWQWKRGPHSAKPEAFLDIVEQVSPGPYLELFSRRQRFGWDTWGDQSFNDVTLNAEAAS